MFKIGEGSMIHWPKTVGQEPNEPINQACHTENALSDDGVSRTGMTAGRALNDE